MRLTDHPDPDNPRIIRGRDEFTPGPDPERRVPWDVIVALVVVLAPALIAIAAIITTHIGGKP